LKSLYEEKCSACHDAYDPEEKGFTAPEWQSTVDRMMNAHDARTSITDAQAAQIVTYLSEFAPRLGQGTASNEIGIWQTDPAQSVSFPFTYGPNLQSFDIHGGNWKIAASPVVYNSFLKTYNSGNGPGMLVENKDQFQGALDAKVQFQVLKGYPNAAVGLIFGEIDDKNYLAAEYTPSSSVLAFMKVVDGVPATVQQVTMAPSQPMPTNAWHDLRVKVSEGGIKLEIWLDYQKQLSSTDPGWSGGKVGLMDSGQITAAFRQLTVDTYQPVEISPAGDVLLH
jgi:hypothetical protein